MKEKRRKVKALIDFDGTLTNEKLQAHELSLISKAMLAEEILKCPQEEIDSLYSETQERILKSPHLFLWQINGLPATYAYEGAYLLNTVIFQQILNTPRFRHIVENKFPASHVDSVTQCVNQLFHEGSLHVKPHFLDGVDHFLLSLLDSQVIEPVIFTNSETRKISQNLAELGIGAKGEDHRFDDEIEILGDTRQYYLDASWPNKFDNPEHGMIQTLPIDSRFSVDLRRPIYFEALTKIQREGFQKIVVSADGFSLAGALPLSMGLHFFLIKTDYTPSWSEGYVDKHTNGRVVNNLNELKEAIFALSED